MWACRFIPAYVAAAVALVVSVFINVSSLQTMHPYPLSIVYQTNKVNSAGKLSMPQGRAASRWIYIYMPLI